MSEEFKVCDCLTHLKDNCDLPLQRCSDGYRMCCDSNGCKRYPDSSRVSFWPEFAHPRWLSCNDLYRDNCTESCGDNC